jgi:hypothetical protein
MQDNNLSINKLSLKEAFDLYENGKHRRYSLLFSVNGGAFAIAKLLTGTDKPGVVLGHFTLTELAVGMAIFTAIMIFDIYTFGENMRANYLNTAFRLPGKAVLLMLGVMQCVGWILVVW